MRPTRNSKKDEASSDDSNAHLTTEHEEDLPVVTGTNNFTGKGLEPLAALGISFEPDLLANLEDFTPRQETFLKTLLEGTTSRLIRIHQEAGQEHQEEIQRLKAHMRHMQDKMNDTRPLTSMDTPRAI